MQNLVEQSECLYIGIDPGWNNLGLSIVGLGTFITKTLSPKSHETLYAAVKEISALIPASGTAKATIERYVPYGGVMTAESEHTNWLIGAITYELQRTGAEVYTTRAIDWKSALCKRLFVEKDFRNPSKSFDKKYSVAAARCLHPEFKGTDHAADALCLAYFPTYMKKKAG